MRKVWYHQIWIQNNLDFIVSDLTYVPTIISDEFLRSHMPNTESVFKGEFVVLEGDFLPQGAVQIGSYVHVQKSR